MRPGDWMAWSVKKYPVVAVRPLRRIGSAPYQGCHVPDCTVETRDAVYLLRKGHPFIITRLNWLDARKEPDSEVNWLLKEEIRLLSAIMLGVYGGKFKFSLEYPPAILTYDKIKHIALSKRLGDHLESLLQVAYPLDDKVLDLMGVPFDNPLTNDEIDIAWDAKWGPYTPQRLYRMIDPGNNIFLRCMACWIKADMLFSHLAFAEEAYGLAYFALDGILKLFHEEFKVHNPRSSLRDMLQALVGEFSIPEGYVEYLTECYENRTIIVHPHNNIERWWFPAFSADDFFDATRMIQDLAWIYVTRDKSRWTPNRNGDTLLPP